MLLGWFRFSLRLHKDSRGNVVSIPLCRLNHRSWRQKLEVQREQRRENRNNQSAKRNRKVFLSKITFSEKTFLRKYLLLRHCSSLLSFLVSHFPPISFLSAHLVYVPRLNLLCSISLFHLFPAEREPFIAAINCLQATEMRPAIWTNEMGRLREQKRN